MRKLLYRTYRGLTALVRWGERVLTAAGRLVLGAAVLTAVLGIDTTQSTAYRLFAFLLVLLVLALIGARARRRRFAVERVLPLVASAGEAFEYRLCVRNLGPGTARAPWVRDELDDPRPSFEDFRAAMRLPSYRGWQRLLARRRTGRVQALPCADLAPGAVVELRVRAEALRRGRMHFTGVTIGCEEPLGLARGLASLPLAANLTVLPRRYALPVVDLPGGRRYQKGGVSLASSVGDSEEFVGLRDYRPGDPLQKVHWKSFARTGKPVVRETQDEYFERHALVLDTCVPTQAAEAFEEAVAVAASFACTIDTQECLLDLMFVGVEAYTFTAGRGQLSTANLLEVLAGVTPCAGQPFALLARALRERAGALSGCILIFAHWDRERADLVDALRAHGSALRVYCVSAAPLSASPPWLIRLVPGQVQTGLASA